MDYSWLCLHFSDGNISPCDAFYHIRLPPAAQGLRRFCANAGTPQNTLSALPLALLAEIGYTIVIPPGASCGGQ